ncbi:MAG: hypothetical protein RLZZ510_1068 [Bacteroidota bacterium]
MPQSRRNFLYLCNMGTDFQQRLARIRGRVVEVVQENGSLKRENLLLSQELEALNKTIALQKNALAELKEENKLIKLAKEMSMSGSDVHDLKIKINELVRDIDRCIDLLNE